MRYASATAFRAALEQRLRTRHTETGVPLLRLRKGVAFERFLARLVVAAPERWVLKGALALDFRLGVRTRTTRDIDLGRQDTEEDATEDFIAAQALDLGDFFSFQVERVGRVEDTGELATIRYRVRAELAGRLFEEFPVDVSFSDPLDSEPDQLTGSDLLNFADIKPVTVPVLAIEQHLAEKVHAYTRLYQGGALASTRPKDLIDIVLVKIGTQVQAAALRAALERTFSNRATHPLPRALPRPPDDWAVPYARMAEAVGLDPDLARGYGDASAMLAPVLQAQARGRWDPERGAWGA